MVIMDNCIFTPEKLRWMLNWVNVGTECRAQYLNA